MTKGRAKALDNPDFGADDLIKRYNSGERDFSGLELDGDRFIDVDLNGVILDRCSLVGAIFEGCDLRSASFTAADLEGAEFNRCDCRGASFRRCDLTDADLVTSRLDGADFEKAELFGCQRTPPPDPALVHPTKKLVKYIKPGTNVPIYRWEVSHG